jgi:hypothetical protein
MNASDGLKKQERNDKQSGSGTFLTQLHSFGCLLKRSYKTVILLVIVAVVSVAGSALVAIHLSDSGSELYVPSVATIKTIGVEAYWDQSGETKIDALSWDEIKLEKLEWDEITLVPVQTTVYIKSVSNFRVTMDIFLTDWIPEEISDHVILSWDYEGAEMDPGEIIPVTLTLSAPSTDAFIDYILENDIHSFEVSIHFVATD